MQFQQKNENHKFVGENVKKILKAQNQTQIKNQKKISEKRHKIWTRQSTFAGGPTVVRKDSSGPKIRPNSSYGFGSRIDRFTAIQSTPTSPMVETNPLKWFVKEIDISDSAGKNTNPTPSNTSKKSSSNPRTTEMFGHRPIRTRSRHDCHFSTGSSVPMGNLDPLNSLNIILYHFESQQQALSSFILVILVLFSHS